MLKLIKLFLINLIVLLFLIICSDLILGYWFKDYNFGPQLRGKRIQKIVFNHNNEKTTYLRDFYGFREDKNIYEKYDASKIKIIFNGGSTGDEMYLNYNDTIVGNLNSYLNKDGKPEHSFIFNGSNVLYKNKKTIQQNHISKAISNVPINGTKSNYNGSYYNPNNPENKLKEPCHTIVHKITNYSNQRNYATSQKSRIARLKFNNVTAREINNYGQCPDAFKGCFSSLNKSVKSFPMNV